MALGLVHRLRPDWVAVELQQAAGELGESAQRLSRLTTCAVTAFEQALAILTRRGRPPRDRAADETQAELSLTRALLTVATAILACVSLRGRVVKEHIVGAWKRLANEPGMTQERFCKALALPPRTLRSWLAHPPASEAAPERELQAAPAPKLKRRTRPPRRPRFGFDVMLPETQIGADTTDLSAFGVPLKLIAAQDIGGRDEQLFDAVLVEDHESAALVTQVLTEALSVLPGAQAITDQGTPYMAAATREALAALEVEHAPQREGDPLGKSTVERAFRTLKSIAQPLLSLADHAAAKVPALCNAELAAGFTKLVIAALLRAYQCGARAARNAMAARPGLDEDTLRRLAQESREHAVAQERSRRLLLSHVHEVFNLAGSAQTFVNQLCRYPIDVLHEAERMFRTQVHRDDIRDRKSYFAALVRNAYDDYLKARARAQRDEAEREQLARAHAVVGDAYAAWRADPAAWLRHALELIAVQWRPVPGGLLFDGHGLGFGWARAALRLLVEQLGPDAAADVVEGVLHAFRLSHLDSLGPHGVDAIVALARELLPSQHAPEQDPTQGLVPTDASAILRVTGRNQRPPRSDRLRI